MANHANWFAVMRLLFPSDSIHPPPQAKKDVLPGATFPPHGVVGACAQVSRSQDRVERASPIRRGHMVVGPEECRLHTVG